MPKKKNKRKTETETIEEAVGCAVEECIEEDILADFLRKHKAEVKDVCITEYNEERVMGAIRAEGYEEGRISGLQEGRISGLQEGRETERIHGIRNLVKAILDLGENMEVAVAKTAKQYEETEQHIWDIWEAGEQ